MKRKKLAQQTQLKEPNNPFLNYEHKKKIKDTEIAYQPQRLNDKLRDYCGRQLVIKRLFYPDNPIPVAEHYINLSILPSGLYQEQFNDAVRKISEARKGEDLYEYSTNLYGQTQGVLKPEHIIPEGISEHCRILVLGNAGIGKSTLTEYLCYLWAKARSKDQETAFSRYKWVFRIPIRNLTSERYPDHETVSLLDVFEKECFLPALNQENCFLSLLEKKKLETALYHAYNNRQILIIVDGFDEITDQMTDKIDNVIEKLLKFNQVLVTSRPCNLFGFRNKYQFNENVLYEITGFSPQEIKNYVEHFFQTIPDKANDDIKEFMSFLSRNNNIAGACRIPIQLELLCSTWDKHPIQDIYYSITHIYNLVTDALCRRYLDKTNVELRDLTQFEITNLCYQPLAFLEHLGYQSIEEARLFFRLDATIRYLDVQIDKNPPWVDQQKRFGFITPINMKGQFDGLSNYYFNHLIFRDYFAARFIANCLQQFFCATSGRYFSHQWPRAQGSDVTYFLQQRFFDQRNELVFWFVMGILADEHDIQTAKNYIKLLLHTQDIAQINLCCVLVRFLDEANSIVNCFSELIWEYLLQLFKLMFKPYFRIFLLHNHFVLFQRLAISPTVLNYYKIEDFFVGLIGKSDLYQLDRIIKFYCEAKIKLSVKIQKILIDKILNSNFESTLDGFNIFHQIAQKIGVLCKNECMALDFFQSKFADQISTTAEKSLSIIVLSVAQKFDSNEQQQVFKNDVQSIFKDLQQPVFIRCAACVIFGRIIFFPVFLLLMQDKNLYTDIDLNACVKINEPDQIQCDLKQVIEYVSQSSDFNLVFEMIDMVHQSDIACFSQEYFLSLTTNFSSKTSLEKLKIIYCWLQSLKDPNLNTESACKIKNTILKSITAMLTTRSDIDEEFFVKILALLPPAPKNVTPMYNTVRQDMVDHFEQIFNRIEYSIIKKHIAVFITRYKPTGCINYIHAINYTINSDYSEQEIATIMPKIANISQLGVGLVIDMQFSLQNCSGLLKQLAIGERTNIIALTLSLAGTPTTSLLKYIDKQQQIQNSHVAECMLAVILLRYITVGKALYFKGNGFCYFEEQIYKTHALTAKQKTEYEKIFQKVLKLDLFKYLPQSSDELTDELSENRQLVSVFTDKTDELRNQIPYQINIGQLHTQQAAIAGGQFASLQHSDIVSSTSSTMHENPSMTKKILTPPSAVRAAETNTISPTGATNMTQKTADEFTAFWQSASGQDQVEHLKHCAQLFYAESTPTQAAVEEMVLLGLYAQGREQYFIILNMYFEKLARTQVKSSYHFLGCARLLILGLQKYPAVHFEKGEIEQMLMALVTLWKDVNLKNQSPIEIDQGLSTLNQVLQAVYAADVTLQPQQLETLETFKKGYASSIKKRPDAIEQAWNIKQIQQILKRLMMPRAKDAALESGGHLLCAVKHLLLMGGNAMTGAATPFFIGTLGAVPDALKALGHLVLAGVPPLRYIKETRFDIKEWFEQAEILKTGLLAQMGLTLLDNTEASEYVWAQALTGLFENTSF